MNNTPAESILDALVHPCLFPTVIREAPGVLRGFRERILV